MRAIPLLVSFTLGLLAALLAGEAQQAGKVVRTAKALGLTIPPVVLARADELIQ